MTPSPHRRDNNQNTKYSSKGERSGDRSRGENEREKMNIEREQLQRNIKAGAWNEIKRTKVKERKERKGEIEGEK